MPRWLGALSALALVAVLAALLFGLPFASWALAGVWLVAAGVATVRDKGV